jgi:hypothetical protein
MKTAVQFDVDGVLADFCRGFTRFARTVLDGSYAVPDVGDMERTTYGTVDLLGKHADACVWDALLTSPDFWSELPEAPGVWPGTWRAINGLQHSRDVYFVTNRVGRRPRTQTIHWLERHGVVNPTVVVTDRKGEFASAARVGYSLEDKAGNALYVAYHCGDAVTSCLLDRPYNRFDHRVVGQKVRRVDAVQEFLDLIEAEGR